MDSSLFGSVSFCFSETEGVLKRGFAISSELDVGRLDVTGGSALATRASSSAAALAIASNSADVSLALDALLDLLGKADICVSNFDEYLGTNTSSVFGFSIFGSAAFSDGRGESSDTPLAAASSAAALAIASISSSVIVVDLFKVSDCASIATGSHSCDFSWPSSATAGVLGASAGLICSGADCSRSGCFASASGSVGTVPLVACSG